MPLCPNQHESDNTGFCSVCGIEIVAALPVHSEAKCPECTAERLPDGGDFCEVCGYNFLTGASGNPFARNIAAPAEAAVISPEPAPPPLVENAAPAQQPAPPPQVASKWELVASVDPTVGKVPEEELPADRDERIFPLDLPDQLIGRRSPRRQFYPEISLDSDDAVSHRHARVIRQPSGAFALLDLGSSNGTYLNGAAVKPNVPIPLADGDKITLGRWTALAVRSRD